MHFIKNGFFDSISLKMIRINLAIRKYQAVNSHQNYSKQIHKFSLIQKNGGLI